MARNSLRLTSRFAVVLVVLIPSLLAIMAVSFRGLQSGRDVANGLYQDHLLTSESVTGLDIALEDAHQTSLEALLANDSVENQRLVAELVLQISPRVQAALARVVAHVGDDPAERPQARSVAGGWAQFQQLVLSGALQRATAARRAAVAREVTGLFDKTTTAAKSIVATEDGQSARAHRHALAVYRSTVELMLLAGLLCLLSAAGVVIWLIRAVLPRTVAYSSFATDISQGRYDRSIPAVGTDELAQLGKVLNELAHRRQEQDGYDRHQLQLQDGLQAADSEDEARDLLHRHLHRTLTGSSVTILNRNNSADRLQAVTSLDPDSPLHAALESTTPRSCLAVRNAQPHTAHPGEQNLVSCPVCTHCSARTTCTPLIVGGQVIGSVLADHPDPLDALQRRAIVDSVNQAAPVIGNLRNLALAERRAATDSLTGLPNKRAIYDTLRQMTAHAARTFTPLSALMCDLDHFKHINDRYGHGRGDDVLAAVGVFLTTSLRASDFAGRYGGEEFLILLPDTDAAAAFTAAEKLRTAITAIRIGDIEHAITMSIGIAELPQHGLDADALLRAADRALYTAKNSGRNRTEIFTTRDQPRATEAAGAPGQTTPARPQVIGS